MMRRASQSNTNELRTANPASARRSDSKTRTGAVLPHGHVGGTHVAMTVRVFVADVTSQIAMRDEQGVRGVARNCGWHSPRRWPLDHVHLAVLPEPLCQLFAWKS